MPRTPFGRRRAPRRRSRLKPLAVGGALAAAVAGALTQRESLTRIAGRLTGGSGGGAPDQESPVLASYTDPLPAPAEPVTPVPANYDLSGPAENTSTPLPVAPLLQEPDAFDEEAEIAAAAAEAAAIGGTGTPYASSDLEGFASEEERPLAEAGGGVSEGFEQAEAELADAASPYDGPSPYELQIEEALEAQDNPYVGESAEALEYTENLVDVDQPGDDLGASATGASSPAFGSEDPRGDEDPDRPVG